MEYYLALEKETDTGFSMDEPQTRYVKWNKVDTKNKYRVISPTESHWQRQQAEWWLPGQTEGEGGVTV